MTLGTGSIDIESINVELGRSAGASLTFTSDADCKLLAQKPSGPIGLHDFRSKGLSSYTVTAGVFGSTTGYVLSLIGSVAPTNLKSAQIRQVIDTTAPLFSFNVSGSQSIDFIYAVRINGKIFYRSDATYFTGSSTSWQWSEAAGMVNSGVYSMDVFY